MNPTARNVGNTMGMSFLLSVAAPDRWNWKPSAISVCCAMRTGPVWWFWEKGGFAEKTDKALATCFGRKLWNGKVFTWEQMVRFVESSETAHWIIAFLVLLHYFVVIYIIIISHFFECLYIQFRLVISTCSSHLATIIPLYPAWKFATWGTDLRTFGGPTLASGLCGSESIGGEGKRSWQHLARRSDLLVEIWSRFLTHLINHRSLT